MCFATYSLALLALLLPDCQLPHSISSYPLQVLFLLHAFCSSSLLFVRSPVHLLYFCQKLILSSKQADVLSSPIQSLEVFEALRPHLLVYMCYCSIRYCSIRVCIGGPIADARDLECYLTSFLSPVQSHIKQLSICSMQYYEVPTSCFHPCMCVSCINRYAVTYYLTACRSISFRSFFFLRRFLYHISVFWKL